MSDIANYIRYEVAEGFHNQQVLKRFFSHWKYSLAKYNAVVPLNTGAAIYALCKWIALSFSEMPNQALFPFYAVVELEGVDGALFSARVRNYMVDKIDVPAKNLPLLVHSVAQLDAFQLQRCFYGWKEYYTKCFNLDVFARRLSCQRSLRRWFRKARKRTMLKLRFSILKRWSDEQRSRGWWRVWRTLLRGFRHQRIVVAPRQLLLAFTALRRLLNSHQYQQLSQRNGLRFHLQKQCLRSLQRWVGRLTNAMTVEQFLRSNISREAVFDAVLQCWIDSLFFQRILLSALSAGRSRWFRFHPLIIYLANTGSRKHSTQEIDRSHINALIAELYHPDPASAIAAQQQQQLQQQQQRIVEEMSAEFPSAEFFSPPPSPSRSRSRSPGTAQQRHVSFSLHNDADFLTSAAAAAITTTSAATSALGGSYSGNNNNNYNNNNGGNSGGSSAFDDPYAQQALRLSALYTSPPARTAATAPAFSGTSSRTSDISSSNAAAMRSFATAVAAPLAPVPAAPPLWQSLIKLQRNRGSRMAQGALNLCAAWFVNYRQLLHSFRWWMHRVPQIKLDNVSSIALLFDRTSQQQFALKMILRRHREHQEEAVVQSQRLQQLQQQQQQQLGAHSIEEQWQLQWQQQQQQQRLHSKHGSAASEYGSIAYFYFQFKRSQRAVRVWRSNIIYRRRLRSAHLRLQRSTTAVQQTTAFAAWLICTARSQQLSRAANRVICNRFQRSAEQAFFAWRHQFERAFLIRTNQIQLLQLRNQEIADFAREQHSKRLRRSQYAVLKDWALTVKDRKRGRTLAGICSKYKVIKLKFLALQQWKLVLSLDVIVNCLKTLWYGYRERHILHRLEYRYLRWIRPRIPKYLSFRRWWLKKQLFHVLHLYSERIAHLKTTATNELNALRALRRLRRHAIRCRHHKRAKIGALAGRQQHWKRQLIKRLRNVRQSQLQLVSLQQRYRRLLHVRLMLRLRSCYHIHRCWRRAKRKFRDLLLRGFLLALLQRRQQLQRFRLRERMSRRILKLKQWRRFVAVCRLLLRIRRFCSRSRRLAARRCLRRWRMKLQRRRWRLQQPLLHHRSRRLRHWFRWWRILSHRNSAAYRQINRKHGVTGYYDREEVWRVNKQHRVYRAKLMRGLVSAVFRHYFQRLVRHASSRRKFRKQDNYFKELNRKQQLFDAFRQLHEIWHRGLRRGGLSRKIRRIGFGNISNSHHNNNNNNNSSVIIRSSGGGSSSRMRFDRLAELQQRLRRNLVRSAGESQQARWLSCWLQRHRRRRREQRHSRSFHDSWRRQRLHYAFRRLFLQLVYRWKYRNKLGRFLKFKYQRKLRTAVAALKTRSRLRGKDYSLLVRFIERKRAAKKKELFSRLYTLCFFKRHQYKLYCVKRLRLAVKAAVRLLRIFAFRRLHGPAVVNVRQMDKKRKRKAFIRLRGIFLRQKYRIDVLLGRLEEHFTTRLARRHLRYWWRYAALKQQLRATARRLLLRPAMRLWLSQSLRQLQHRGSSIRVQQRQQRRVRGDCLRHWFWLSLRHRRLRLASEEVAFNSMILRKASVLYSWMRIIDTRVTTSKFYAVRTLCGRNLARKCIFHWHKMSLISELSTWKSCRCAVRDWLLTAYWSQRQRLTLLQADSFCAAYLAQTCLYLLYRRARLRNRFAKRRYNAYRLQHLRSYVDFLKRWKRRMYFVYRAKVLLDSLQQHPLRFNLHRSLMKWFRIVTSRRSKSRRRIMRRCFNPWRNFSYRKHHLRLAVMDRMQSMQRRHQLLSVWRVLLSNCAQLRVQRLLMKHAHFTLQQQLFHHWKKSYRHRSQQRHAVQLWLSRITSDEVRRCFLVWRIKTTVGWRLGQSILQSKAWQAWRKAAAASIKAKQTATGRVFYAWRGLIRGLDHYKADLLSKKSAIVNVFIRRLRDDDSKRQLAFWKWKTCDTITPLRDFYKNPVQQQTSQPMLQMLAQLAHSHAGKFLTALPASYRGVNIAAPGATATAATNAAVATAGAGGGHFEESRARRRPVLRLQAIQAHLAQRFQTAGAGQLKPGELRRSYELANNRRALQKQRYEQADKNPVNQRLLTAAVVDVDAVAGYAGNDEMKASDNNNTSLRDFHLTGKEKRRKQAATAAATAVGAEPAADRVARQRKQQQQFAAGNRLLPVRGNTAADVAATAGRVGGMPSVPPPIAGSSSSTGHRDPPPPPMTASRGRSINMQDLM